MKQEEKTKLTKERILQAAFQEFGTKGYAATTLNALCSRYGIAKGLLYHNFEGKDDLYLACVSQCFSDIMEYLKSQNVRDDLKKSVRIRFQYFAQHPCSARIFFEAMLQLPAALAEKVQELRKDFDAFNREIYRAALSKLTFREGVTEADAIEYYELMQDIYNGYFRSSTYATQDFDSLVAKHEEHLAKMLNIMLYGIALGERRREK